MWLDYSSLLPDSNPKITLTPASSATTFRSAGRYGSTDQPWQPLSALILLLSCHKTVWKPCQYILFFPAACRVPSRCVFKVVASKVALLLSIQTSILNYTPTEGTLAFTGTQSFSLPGSTPPKSSLHSRYKES